MNYVIVTGAAGGMGKSTTLNLSKSGFKVFALDYNDLDYSDSNIIPIKCDITNSDSINNAYEEIRKTTNDLYAIIHLAGIYYLDSLIEIDENRFEKIFNVNVIGPYLINKAFINMLKRNSRIIIVTSELAIRDPLPFTGIYAITKGALDKYAYSLAMELQLKDIWVSVLRPGAVATPMLKASTDELDNFCNNTKMYNISANNFKNVVNSVEAKYILPDILAKKINKILNKTKPKFNYSINRNKLLIMLDLLPIKLRFKIIKKILNKKK